MTKRADRLQRGEPHAEEHARADQDERRDRALDDRQVERAGAVRGEIEERVEGGVAEPRPWRPDRANARARVGQSRRSDGRAAMRIGTSATAQRMQVSVIGPIWPTASRPTIECPAQISVVRTSIRSGFAQAARKNPARGAVASVMKAFVRRAASVEAAARKGEAVALTTGESNGRTTGRSRMFEASGSLAGDDRRGRNRPAFRPMRKSFEATALHGTTLQFAKLNTPARQCDAPVLIEGSCC